MKRIEDAKNIQNKIQEYLGMQNADGNVASITVPRLIPLKFNTVWSSDPALVETVHCLSYGSLMPRQIDLPKTELRITTSPFILDEEFVFLQNGIDENKISKGVNVHEQIFESKHDGLMCVLRGKTLMITELEGRFIEPSSLAKLAHIEHAAAVAGAKNILIVIKEAMQPLEYTLQNLEERGFKKLPDKSLDKDSGQISYTMIKKCKKLSDELLDNEIVFKDHGSDPDPNPEPTPRIFEQFSNFMIKDEDGAVQGGAMWHFGKDAKEVPYAELDLFFIGENLRGTGLGMIIMKKIEDYVQDMEIYKLYLSTGEYEAPEFYKKMGYKLIETLPKIMDGHNGYNFVKELNHPDPVDDIDCAGGILLPEIDAL